MPLGVQAEGYHLRTCHPLFCGMLLFLLQLYFQSFGLMLPSLRRTILLVSHLYEASKHEGFCSRTHGKIWSGSRKFMIQKAMFRGREAQKVNGSFIQEPLFDGRRSRLSNCIHGKEAPFTTIVESVTVGTVLFEREFSCVGHGPGPHFEWRSGVASRDDGRSVGRYRCGSCKLLSVSFLQAPNKATTAMGFRQPRRQSNT